MHEFILQVLTKTNMSLSKINTRNEQKCPVFGYSCKLPTNVLPTYRDMMKHYNYIKQNIKTERPKELTVTEIAETVAADVKSLWQKASIPIVSHTRILKLIRCAHDEYRNIMKPYKGRKSDGKYLLKLRTYAEKSTETLFDIAACKCVPGSCKCPKQNKIPPDEQDFLQDQRTTRLMYIGSVDKVTSAILQKRYGRKVKEQARVRRALDFSDQQCSASDFRSDESSDIDCECETDGESTEMANDMNFVSGSGASTSSQGAACSKQMRRKLPKLAKLCDRFGVSDRAGASIATAVLEDCGVVSQTESGDVIDRYKLRRERKLARERSSDTIALVEALYFDGRKDKTLKLEKKGSRWFRKTASEEHVTLMCEPGGKFLTHVTPDSSTARGITDSICKYYDEIGLDMSKTLGIGCDGTATNTGATGGIICLLEKKLGKPLQWLLCQLHANELPLRHIMKHLDGPTTGPQGFAGVIGSALTRCEYMPVCPFNSISSELQQELTIQDLSTDQRYLYEISKSVSSGFCPEELARRNPGKMAHSRWLTTANRVLRLYISTSNPTPNLQMLASFIVRVYAPVWFAIKSKPSCKDGARHLWLTVHLSRSLPPEVRSVIDPVIQRNAYFCHPENLLLAMIADEREHVRQLGLRRILKAKQQHKTDIRKFVIPTINFDAGDYIDIINWTDVDVTVPPLLSQVPVDEISRHVFEGNDALLPFLHVPCHTQAVERHVKLVTEASQSVCGEKARNGFIKNRIASRQQMAAFNNKRDYCFN